MRSRGAGTQTLVAVVAMAALVVGSCGGDDDDDAGPVETDEIVDIDTSSDDGPGGGSDDDAEGDGGGLAFGYVVSGPEGTVVEVGGLLDQGGGRVRDDRTHTLDDTDGGRAFHAFSPFIVGGELEIEVTEGGPVTVEMITTTIDPDVDPLAVSVDDVEIVDTLGTSEASVDDPATIAFG